MLHMKNSIIVFTGENNDNNTFFIAYIFIEGKNIQPIINIDVFVHEYYLYMYFLFPLKSADDNTRQELHV